MREIHGHRVDDGSSGLRITADEPSAKYGNASHLYTCEYGSTAAEALPIKAEMIAFQNGPIKEVGMNGLTNEALLAIVADRLRGFQSGEFSCRENALALTKVEEALHWMHSRTRARMARGVEGVNIK